MPLIVRRNQVRDYLAAVERGTLPDWRRLAKIVQAEAALMVRMRMAARLSASARTVTVAEAT